ncbi:hypothetical protein [Paenibacillus durus]|uniref:Uncharacterized protein n=2 Tax=Paenibacillus durus TaxID=44251 RepID=A0A0F7FCW3_PAEDU|nr:hypothetical protein [Paenibacillus durus]AKG36648.1 hypothetical protein VK70_20750 [Paenibacillus durus ATCC 35681]
MKLTKTKTIKSLIKSVLIAIILFSVLLGIYNFLPGTIMWYESIWEYKVRDFDTYKSDFQTIADLAYREFSKGQMKDSYILVSENSDGTVHLSYENFKTEDMVEVTMSQREKKSLEKINANAFHQGDMAYLSVIRVYKDQVEFKIENGLYSLVNRRDGHKPKYVNTPDTKRHFKLKKISAHWYHARIVED